MKIKSLRVGSSLLLCLLLSGPTHAEVEVERRSVRVNIAGIDISTEAGRDIVYRKLKTAAKQVCSDGDLRRSLSKSLLYSQCVTQALREAVSQIPDPAFGRYAAKRIGVNEPVEAAVARTAR